MRLGAHGSGKLRVAKHHLMSLVELARYPNAMEAAMVRGLLQVEGIDSVAFDGGMNVADSSGWLVPVRIMVLDEDLEAAKLVIA